jgi:two-component system, OmpR family, sensor histidine kinase TorS
MLDRLRPDVEALVEALQQGADDDVDRRAHQLKGAAGNFALPDLVAILSTLSRRGATPEPGAAEALRTAAAAAERDLTRSLRALEDQAGVRTAAQ